MTGSRSPRKRGRSSSRSSSRSASDSPPGRRSISGSRSPPRGAGSRRSRSPARRRRSPSPTLRSDSRRRRDSRQRDRGSRRGDSRSPPRKRRGGRSRSASSPGRRNGSNWEQSVRQPRQSYRDRYDAAPQRPAAAAGRGRDTVKPAWMTNGTSAGSSGGAPPAAAIGGLRRDSRERHTDRGRYADAADHRRDRDNDSRRRSSPPRSGNGYRARPQADALPELYTILKGEVVKIETFGAFVSLPGFRKQGLLHISQMANQRVEKVDDVVDVGEGVWVKVTSVTQSEDFRSQKIGLSMKVVDQASGADLDPEHEQGDSRGNRQMNDSSNPEQPPRTMQQWGTGEGKPIGNDPQAPAVYTVHRGQVSKVEEFGCFVSLPGFRKQGLVHKSQLADYRVESVSDAVAVGDSVWVKVLEVKDADNPREMRVSLSMKLVDQNNGKDLDPSNEVAESEASRRSLPSNSLQAPLELGAVFNTVCSKCGAKGHMSVDCFSRDGKQYDLVAQDEAEPLPEMRGVDNSAHAAAAATVPMGRGRGAVLPSWMTSAAGGDNAAANDTASSTSESEGKHRKHKKHKKSSDSKKHKKAKKAKKEKRVKKHKEHKHKDKKHKHSTSSKHEDSASD